MRNLVLFFICMACLHFGYNKFGRKTLNPKVIGEAVVQLDTADESKKVYFAIVNNRRCLVDKVLSEHGMWENPRQDSLVTVFTVKKDTLTHFMSGRVDAEAIDKAYQNQVPMVFAALGMMVFVALLHKYQEDSETITYDDSHAKKNAID